MVQSASDVSITLAAGLAALIVTMLICREIIHWIQWIYANWPSSSKVSVASHLSPRGSRSRSPSPNRREDSPPLEPKGSVRSRSRRRRH